MTGDALLISVIIPVFNGERYVAEALESALGQSYRCIEIIVVDDGSTDHSAAVVQRYSPKVRYCHQANRGIGAARNAGIDLARGTFFAFLDADDLWPEHKLERQMAAFDRDASLDMVFGHIQQFISPELEDDLKKRVRCPAHSEPGRLPGAMLIKRDAFLRVGHFSAAIGEALDWMLRAQDLGLKGTMVSDIVLKRRLHSTNSVLLHGNVLGEYAKYLKASLDRRRAEHRTP